ncbi:hypothetical protein [Microbacterium aoyamense]|nr:hypothetical protein [Microbacterium aoyamense]
MADKFPPMSDFAVAFSAEFRGFMKANKVTGAELATRLGRNEGYVSERSNGKRAVDTNDVDALASLVSGWSGKDLMYELARRTRAALETPNNVVAVDFTVPASGENAMAAHRRSKRDDGHLPEEP